jgi:hypothetical protein
MLNRLAVLTLIAMAAVPEEVRPNRDPEALVVHEWGTFTSIAGETGAAVSWQPLQAANDLPCFVERFRRYRGKGFIRGTVRMETPVLYFYAPQETTVDVSVRFPGGLITEWFPRADVTPADAVADDGLARPGFAGGAKWTGVRVMPRSREDFPAEGQSSHYYLARQTDAAPIAVAGAREKFLFYRGAADTRVPITAMAGGDGSVRVAHEDKAPLGTVVLFERRGSRIGFEIRSSAGSSVSFPRLELTKDLAALTGALEAILVGRGLYAKEATAMVNTWRDSWFEEGTRVFYIVPQAAVEAMLPLDIQPRPASVVRVFVGRMEVMTPATRAAVERALAARDTASLQQYERFLLPIAESVLARPANPASRLDRDTITPFIYGSLAAAARGPACQ